MTANELESIKSGRGLWSKEGVPHKGWTCTGIEDLGAPDKQCEMCESSMVRFVHYMTHPNYFKELTVGCVCAGHMELDRKAAEVRETSMRNRANKRKRWLTRKWKISKKGNPYLKSDGFIISIYKMGLGWGCYIQDAATKEKWFSRKAFELIDDAKLSGFDLISKNKKE